MLPPTILGTSEADTLLGTSIGEVLSGRDGADTLAGGGGNDTIDGGVGIDTAVFSGVFAEYRVTGAGQWVVYDLVGGRDGNDVLARVEYLQFADQRVSLPLPGGPGNDYLYGNDLDDTLYGGDGNDVLVGNTGSDSLFGEAGDDRLEGGDPYYTQERDTLYGGDGNDYLSGGFGADLMIGGRGDDRFGVDDPADVIREAAGEGFDRVDVSRVAAWTLTPGAEVELIELNRYGSELVNLTGNEFANTLHGNRGANVLDGGGGIDLLIGFDGDDQYRVDHVNDSVYEAVGGGNDVIFASVSYGLLAGSEIELLRTDDDAGTTAIEFKGNEFSTTLRGNAGDNRIDGRGGADAMIGLAGNDWYFVDHAGDIVAEAAGGGTLDRVFAATSWTLTAGAEVELLSTDFHAGTAAIDLTGNALANTIYGNAGDNVLSGRGGADMLFGLAGRDVFVFDTALGSGNVDRVRDFAPEDDQIRLASTVFGGLPPGPLAAASFHEGAAAADADDRILYDPATGSLLFDADGSAAGAAVPFAWLATGLALSSADFEIV